MRALWIEMTISHVASVYGQSRPVRALWIEISDGYTPAKAGRVEAREGLVD